MTTRRTFLRTASLAGLASSVTTSHLAAQPERPAAFPAKNNLSPAQWIRAAVNDANRISRTAKGGYGSPCYGKFNDDRMFYTLGEIGWTTDPTDNAQRGLPPVKVPAGFVTDLASIPPWLYSALSPNGKYTFPAVIHDYLYWYQPLPKDQADLIFSFFMVEQGVSPEKRWALYKAVRWFGSSAWNGNQRDRAHGEKRRLNLSLPQKPGLNTTWADWKKDPRHLL